MKLTKKTALITGGANGIGKAIAQRFAKEGAEVIVFDTEKPNYEVNFHQVDISKIDEIEKAFFSIKKLDILVNNAGIYFQANVENTSKEQLDKITDINFKGTFLISKYALPLIKKSKGNIINISSGIGVVPDPASPAYSSTKAAIIMLTKCMAQEYASEGIRINSILPGPINTQLLRNSFSSQKELDDYRKLNPMKQIGKPENVANLAVFLASEEANYVTGGMYSVDGGESTSSLFSK